MTVITNPIMLLGNTVIKVSVVFTLTSHMGLVSQMRRKNLCQHHHRYSQLPEALSCSELDRSLCDLHHLIVFMITQLMGHSHASGSLIKPFPLHCI